MLSLFASEVEPKTTKELRQKRSKAIFTICDCAGIQSDCHKDMGTGNVSFILRDFACRILRSISELIRKEFAADYQLNYLCKILRQVGYIV